MSLLLLFRPHGSSGPVPPAPVITGGGVRHGRKHRVIVRLAEVENRLDTAEFLKAQLNLRHPRSAFVDTSAEEDKAAARAAAAQKALLAREKAMREVAALEAIEKARIEDENMRIMMIIAAAFAEDE